ncbi:S1 family peptidase [Nitrospina watsonii]|uniref:Serine protease n=1 Tax=Nitrospina watsonii TaxID=1323948 RepID=A0ABM9HEI5_9BACT|nr:serine protease [Nitrospina watsonii]CAI2718461.1 conserved protein of unknown function [Nitrospina watsonii]
MQFDYRKNKGWIVFFVVLGVIALSNQRLAMTDPENTYPKRIKRAVRLFFNPPENELDRHLIGKGIDCETPQRLYRQVARATVLIKVDHSIGAGVFIGPRLIATARHVVDGTSIEVVLPDFPGDDLARPGRTIDIDSVHRVPNLDLAFVTTRRSHSSFLDLKLKGDGDSELMIVGHPNRKYYSLQKARIKKKELLKDSEFILFKDNEVFFGNSGGAIVACDGGLMGVVSMMSNYQNAALKQGIGINARTVLEHARRLNLL